MHRIAWYCQRPSRNVYRENSCARSSDTAKTTSAKTGEQMRNRPTANWATWNTNGSALNTRTHQSTHTRYLFRSFAFSILFVCVWRARTLCAESTIYYRMCAWPVYAGVHMERSVCEARVREYRSSMWMWTRLCSPYTMRYTEAESRMTCQFRTGFPSENVFSLPIFPVRRKSLFFA